MIECSHHSFKKLGDEQRTLLRRQKIHLSFLLFFVHVIWPLDDVYIFVQRPTGNEVFYNGLYL